MRIASVFPSLTLWLLYIPLCTVARLLYAQFCRKQWGTHWRRDCFVQYNGFAKCTVYGLHLLRDNPFNRGVDESCTRNKTIIMKPLINPMIYTLWHTGRLLFGMQRVKFTVSYVSRGNRPEEGQFHYFPLIFRGIFSICTLLKVWVRRHELIKVRSLNRRVDLALAVTWSTG